jgi:putative ATP-dependent endonuclease of the OLD family
MRLANIRIENFRSFKDETIEFDPYTCLVGPNGAGKSNVLTALNVFFRNNATTSTNCTSLSSEDFHHCDTSLPITVTVTFVDLSTTAKDDLGHYCRQDRLVVSARAVWNEELGLAEVKQYGSRHVMKDFAPYFAAIASGEKAPAVKAIYDGIRESYLDLPSASTGPAREKALREFEESHPEHCELLEDGNQFYGFTKGANLLAKHVQWVYIPAVKDASSEQEESNRTALGQLLERTIRAKVNFKEPIAALKASLLEQYRTIVDGEQQVLNELQSTLESRLKEWANPAARLELAWHYDRNKSLVVNEPIARAAIGEDKFLGEVARLGHGMQRSFLVALLQELAIGDVQGGPTLLLGVEEPELYQHPPQAQHMASVLEDLATKAGSNSQVIVSTHSPYFVSSKGFESVRMVRKHAVNKCSLISATTYERIEQLIADATGDKPDPPTVTMAAISQIMQPSQNELYFTHVAVLVEGIEDIAVVATHLTLTGRWSDFRQCGCHFVTAAGKRSLSRPLAIAKELCIPTFVIFDGDCDQENKDEQRKDNTCVLRLCGVTDFDPLPTEPLCYDNVVMWPTRILDVVKSDFGLGDWEEVVGRVRKDKGFVRGVRQKNTLLIAAVLEEFHQRGRRSNALDKVCDALLAFARPPSV